VADQRSSRFKFPSLDVAGVLRPSPPAQRVAPRETVPGPLEWRGTMRTRLLVFTLIFAAWTVGIEARLIYLQVFQHADLAARADRQQLKTVKLAPKRGEIFDRNGRLLAYSVDADTISAVPSEIEDPETVARLVCGALDHCDAALRKSMAERLRGKGQFAYLQRKVSPDAARRVRELNLPGIALYKESRRYYPKKELAAHVLGYVGLDNDGLAGLESAYDARIRGREGRILVQEDARNRAVAIREERLPTAGDGLELTIDQYLQHIAERELRAGVEQDNAAGGTAIIMQPQTGEILALANWPTYNPNSYNASEVVARRNRAVQDLYEPGSTFKVVTASAALEEGVTHPDDLIDCAPGFINVPGRPRPVRDVHAYGVLPFTDVMVKSSNVGAIKVGWKLGAERLSRYVSRFGFGQAIAPDFRGENPGIVWNPTRLNDSAIASISIGYQVGVTPLQMASAVSAVANGGMLIEPRVVRAFIRDGQREQVTPKVLRRAITTETAATLTGIMEAVVERGTATTAQISGYTVAGKTGTASKLIDGTYSKSEYNASFVGFVPSRKPALTIIVVIDSPHGRGYYGGTVAGPVFQRIAEASLRHLGIGPTLNAPPPVLVARHDQLLDDVAPRPSRPAVLAAASDSSQAGFMPDLRGMSAREALRTMTRIGMVARMKGDGFVIDQAPLPGTPLVRGRVGLLTLGRRPPVLAAGDPSQ
jgi:cell division protein FtsI (penicillin-binding protein 3)